MTQETVQVATAVIAFLTVVLIAARDLYRERQIRKDHLEDRRMDAEDRRAIADELVQKTEQVAQELKRSTVAQAAQVTRVLEETTAAQTEQLVHEVTKVVQQANGTNGVLASIKATGEDSHRILDAADPLASEPNGTKGVT